MTVASEVVSTSEIHSVRTHDGYDLRYRVWPAAGAAGPEKTRATVVFLNGVMSHSGWFEPLAPGLTAAGVRMVGADRRGTGSNELARGDAPSAKHLVGDAAAIVAAEQVERAPLVVVGWCWGAVLAVHLAPVLASRLDGMVLVAPGLCPTPLVSEKAQAEAARIGPGPDDEPALPSPLSEDLFTRGPALESFILKDTLRLSAFSRRFRLIMDRMALFAPLALGKIEVPCMLVLADDDRATDNAKTREVFGALPSLEHARVPGEHGVQFDAPAEIVEHILSFITRRELSRSRARPGDSR